MTNSSGRRESALIDSSETEPTETVTRVVGTGIPVRGNDIDTDQIIPARFMKIITFDGLGQFAFFDQRFDSVAPEEQRDGDGEVAEVEKPHPFNDDRFEDASILVVNANFGCGSSREHAPQALARWGIDAIVGESFAEIFAGNCLALGIPTVVAEQDTVAAIQEWSDEHPDDPIQVDIENETVTYGERAVDVHVDTAHALVDGVWDTTALMTANSETVKETALSLPYIDDSEISRPTE